MTWDQTHTDVLRERFRLDYHLRHGSGMLDEMMRDIGVPDQLLGRRLDDFTEELSPQLHQLRQRLNDMLVAVEDEPNRFEHGDIYGVVLVGLSNTGKTSFCSAWLRKMIGSGFTGRFITVEQFAKFKTSWIELSSNASRYEDYAERADAWRVEMWRLQAVYEFLVVDDVGRTKVPEFVLGELHDLVRERAAHGCFTLLTSNMRLADMDRYVSEGFASFMRREMIVMAVLDPVKNEDQEVKLRSFADAR